MNVWRKEGMKEKQEVIKKNERREAGRKAQP